MTKAWSRSVLRLAGLLGCVALAASRIGLIGHELVGHGGVALALGAKVTAVRLFWFGGGWIHYVLAERSNAATFAVSIAGIAVELVIATALWLGVRGDTLGRRIVRGIGAALVVHASWYLATGAFHGFGDGRTFYRMLGDARVPLAIAAGLVTCAATFLGARAITGPLVATLPGTTRQRAIGFAIAAVVGGGTHAALTIGEIKLRRDDNYAQVMQSERDRKIAIALAQWQQAQAARGMRPDEDAARVERSRLESANRTFPFALVLALATLASLIAGISRTRIPAEQSVSRGLLVRAVVCAALSIGAVIVIDLALG